MNRAFTQLFEAKEWFANSRLKRWTRANLRVIAASKELN